MEHFRVAENRTFRVDDHHFLFLPADKAIFEMDAFTAGFLQRLDGKESLDSEEILEGLQGTEEEKKTYLREFVKLRVLQPAEIPTGSVAWNTACDEGIPLKTLILHVTEACNLRCRYCYYADGAPTPRGPVRMAPKTAERAVDFLFEHSGNIEEVVLVFFGGEPLLNFDLIAHSAAYARRQAGAAGKRVRFALTTNGTLLTEEVIRFLDEQEVSVTLSIDGYEEAHDRHRCFPDGSPSYRVLFPKVSRLLQVMKAPPVARVTLVDHPGEVPAILDHLLGMGFVEAGFAPVTSGDPRYRLDEDGMDRLLEAFRDLAGRFTTRAREGGFLGFSNLIDILVSLHQDELKQYPCGAGLGLFSVSTEGKLYLCQRFTGQPAWCMGDIFQGFDAGKIRRFRESAEINQKEECRRCWVRTICTGGCYHEACVREGDALKPNLHYCRWIQDWIETGLETYGRLSLECPEYLDRLSLMRGHSPDC